LKENPDFKLNNIPFIADPADATESCEVVNTLLLKPNSKSSCIAIVGQASVETNHVLQWMRTKRGVKNGPDPNLPLAKASRGTNGGEDNFTPIRSSNISQSQSLLKQYMQHVDAMKEELSPIAKRVANKNNEIIVVTSNFGQSALLENFVCHARANGFDLSSILVFPTDQQTYDLAKGLGLEAFFDEKNFGSLPTKEADRYGDRTFVTMMYAKVISVQIINHLGYNVLFQDIDVVWYKHPLSSGVFTDPTSPLSDFDMLFQDDGARSLRFAPYAANSGFYYVRHNQRTKYFFTQFLYNGALVWRTHSHQAALIALMSEHSSYFGLKVKVLDGYEFPGGFHYHRRKDFMIDVTKGGLKPYIFHMNWTLNKKEKLDYMKQMGMWYMEDKCVDHTVGEVMQNGNYDEVSFSLIDACCSAEPLLSCHYRDKPSVIDCSDKEPKDKGGKSFW